MPREPCVTLYPEAARAEFRPRIGVVRSSPHRCESRRGGFDPAGQIHTMHIVAGKAALELNWLVAIV